MKCAITKERGIELRQIAKRLNERQEAIEVLKQATADKACEAIAEALMQGQELIRAKDLMPHGAWQDWLATHCPKISYRTANRYMNIAEKLPRVADLTQADSLRAAIALCGMEGAVPKDGDVTEGEIPEYLQAIKRIHGFIKFTEQHPICDYPEEGKVKLRKDFLPVATALYPERFTA